jgi:hypothetical protein
LSKFYIVPERRSLLRHPGFVPARRPSRSRRPWRLEPVRRSPSQRRTSPIFVAGIRQLKDSTLYLMFGSSASVLTGAPHIRVLHARYRPELAEGE